MMKASEYKKECVTRMCCFMTSIYNCFWIVARDESKRWQCWSRTEHNTAKRKLNTVFKNYVADCFVESIARGINLQKSLYVSLA